MKKRVIALERLRVTALIYIAFSEYSELVNIFVFDHFIFKWVPIPAWAIKLIQLDSILEEAIQFSQAIALRNQLLSFPTTAQRAGTSEMI